ncbi:MAG: DUF1186 domain-containing protein [Planctomycetes bacterium]|nr:DUF1186 domain-containing protein [Planctomycetota bacterium]
MGSYNPPVDQLLKIGRPEGANDTIDYRARGIGPEHVPDLIRMLEDEELFATDPEWYAQIHAWRAIGQLRPPDAVEPLLDLIDINEDEKEDGDWSDWITEELPGVLGGYGPEIVPAVLERVEYRKGGYAASAFASVLVEIAQQHPAARPAMIELLCRQLANAATNNPEYNGFLVADLLDLKAVEAWPVIEAAFATDNVEPMIAGDAAEVKYQLGLGPKPVRAPRLAPPPPNHTGLSAKQRHEQRQKQKKKAKKQKKRK